MKIPYRTRQEYIPVDIGRLRPSDSYAQLMKKRTFSIDTLIEQFGKIPDDLLVDRACPTCGAGDYKTELSKDHMNLVRCAQCRLVYVNPVFDEAHYKEIYRSQDYQDIAKGLAVDSHGYRVERFGCERVEIMKHYLPSNASIHYLDVGCSTGFVVEAARDAGWQAMGLDLNPSAIEFGRERGLDLHNQALDEADFAVNSFDAISLFDILEHLVNPLEILRKAISLLKPCGILFLYIPNYDSASRLLMGEHAHFIWPTHHLNYYTIETISDLLERQGLAIEMVMTEGLDIADYIWYQQEVEGKDMAALENINGHLQFFINAGGYGKNLRVIARKHIQDRAVN